jgi:hypothetical protein
MEIEDRDLQSSIFYFRINSYDALKTFHNSPTQERF